MVATLIRVTPIIPWGIRGLSQEDASYHGFRAMGIWGKRLALLSWGVGVAGWVPSTHHNIGVRGFNREPARERAPARLDLPKSELYTHECEFGACLHTKVGREEDKER